MVYGPSSRVEVEADIEVDLRQFIEKVNEERPDLKSLGLGNTSFNELIEILENVFIKTS